jgi:hypothetical protein
MYMHMYMTCCRGRDNLYKLYSNYLHTIVLVHVEAPRVRTTPLSTRVFPTARHMVMPSRSSAVLAKSVRRQAIEVGTSLHALNR